MFDSVSGRIPAKSAERDELSRREFLELSLGGSVMVALGQSSELAGLPLESVSELVRKKSVSPVELVQECLKRIERLNPVLNAFITIDAERSLAQARAAEAELQGGKWRGPLHGIPIALKDNIDTAGMRTTAGSALFADRIPAQDAEVVRRLKGAGSVILGKLNMHEFAFGGTSITSHFGPVHNPWQTDHIAGGSSGGAAAAVAAGLCYGAIGTDTAGSSNDSRAPGPASSGTRTGASSPTSMSFRTPWPWPLRVRSASARPPMSALHWPTVPPGTRGWSALPRTTTWPSCRSTPQPTS